MKVWWTRNVDISASEIARLVQSSVSGELEVGEEASARQFDVVNSRVRKLRAQASCLGRAHRLPGCSIYVRPNTNAYGGGGGYDASYAFCNPAMSIFDIPNIA